MRQYTIALGFLILVSACGKDDLTQQEQIENYLNENGLEALSTPSGLHYIIDELGSDGHPSIQDEVTVHYEGKLTNGDIFDSSIARGMPATFFLTQVIAGWQEGIPLFQKGGKGTLIIPAQLGYGSRRQAGIPPNSVLIFDVELIDFD